MAQTTYRQDADFRDALKRNVGFDTDAVWVLEWIAANFDPEEVFDVGDLEEWADRNGWLIS